MHNKNCNIVQYFKQLLLTLIYFRIIIIKEKNLHQFIRSIMYIEAEFFPPALHEGASRTFHHVISYADAVGSFITLHIQLLSLTL